MEHDDGGGKTDEEKRTRKDPLPVYLATLLLPRFEAKSLTTPPTMTHRVAALTTMPAITVIVDNSNTRKAVGVASLPARDPPGHRRHGGMRE